MHNYTQFFLLINYMGESPFQEPLLIFTVIEGYKELSGIQLTEFINNLKQINEAIKSKRCKW